MSFNRLYHRLMSLISRHILPLLLWITDDMMLRRQLEEAHKTLQMHSEADREKDSLLAQLGKRVGELEGEVFV